MKKFLSVLLILSMLLTSLLAFASCGGGKINEKKVEENPHEAIENAMEASKTGFFADPTGFDAVLDKALTEAGAFGITFESDTLIMDGLVKKIELNMGGKAENNNVQSYIDVLANVQNKDLKAQMFVTKEGAILKSPSVLGSEKSLSFNYAGLTADALKSSAIGKMAGFDREESSEMLSTMTDMIASMKKVLDDAYAQGAPDIDAKMNEIYTLLGIAVAEEKLENAEGKKVDYITITYTFSNATIKALLQHMTKDITIPEEADVNLDQLVADFDKIFDINVTSKMLIAKKTNTIEKIELNGSATVKQETEENVFENVLSATVNGQMNATAATLTVDATPVEGDKITVVVTAGYKEENGANVYDLAVNATVGTATVEFAKATFTYTKANGAFVLNANLALDGTTATPFEMTGNITADEKNAKLEINSLKYDGEALPAFKLTIKASTEPQIPTFPTDAKDILTLTEAEIQAILGEVQSSDLFELIGSMQ